MKKTLAMLLVLLLAASAVTATSCSGESNADVDATTPAETENSASDEGETTEQRLEPDLPDITFTGESMNFYGYRVVDIEPYFFDIYSEGETGEPLNDAVFQRNRTIEERYDITINYTEDYYTNFNDNINSQKPNTTLTELSQPPDLGISLSIPGKKAKMVNGIANPNAKPPMPSAGPKMLPCEATSTKSVPIIGPVHENDTSTSVKAMKKMLIMPDVLSALLSIAFDHFCGNLISNAPKNDIANTTNSKKNMILNIALVDNSLSLPAPNINVIPIPSTK